MCRLFILMLLTASVASAQTAQTLADFERPDLAGWSTSMSPDYYKRMEHPPGDTGQKGLQVVKDPERGQVLAADVRFVDERKSEPCFITHALPNPLPLVRMKTVSFWYKLQKCEGLESFKVRLRTSDTEFTDYDVTPVFGKWTHCVIDTKSGRMVNIWGKIFGSVKQLTFRLDDVDNQNAQFTLLLDDIVATMDQPVEQSYTPRTYQLQPHEHLNTILIHHAAASEDTYWLRSSLRTIDKEPNLMQYPFKGLHFDLSMYGLPEKIDPVRTWQNLLTTDLIVLIDVDPFIMSPAQATWLADLVYSGAGLIVFGGNETLAKAMDFKRPLADALPVTFTPGDPQFVSRKITAGAPHFLNAALADVGLGIASTVQKLTPKAGATVVLKGDDRPILIIGEFGKGRVAVVNAQPNEDQAGDLFDSNNSAYRLLMQRLVQWATRREPTRYITKLRLSPVDVQPGTEVVAEAEANNGRVMLTLRGATGEGIVKGKTGDSPLVWVRMRIPDGESFTYTIFQQPPLKITWPYGRYLTAPGYPLEFTVRVPEALQLPGAMVNATLNALVGDTDTVYAEFPPQPVAPLLTFKTFCPQLKSDSTTYPIHVSVVMNGKTLASARDCVVVHELLRRPDFFPIITMACSGASGHYPSDTGVYNELMDLAANYEYPFNTIAITGLSNIARSRDKQSASVRHAVILQETAETIGYPTIFEYSDFNLVAEQKPTTPCVFSPEYPQALADKLNPQLDVARRTPNLLSVKILDEPTVSPRSMDYCDYCRRIFQQRYGIPMRKFEEIPKDATYERWAFADFMGFYVAEGYRQGYELKQKSGAQFDLLLTYMSTALGYGRPLSDQEDGLDWSRWADRIDFDVYPYFYPDSQKIRMVKAAWCMAYMRQLSRHLQKPWGFYIELDDRNWPFQQNPKEASAECAYEALLHGCDYLNSFIHLPFGTGNDARPERWAWTCQELSKVNRIGPLLTKLARPPAPVAFFYPTAQTFITDQPAPKPYAYACVSQGFGNVDVLPEEVAVERKHIGYEALIMLGCDILHADMAPVLEQWVRQGGVLILDHLPTQDHKGTAHPFLRGVTAKEGETASWQVGKGKVIRLGFDLEQSYRDAIERDQPAEAARLRRLMARLLEPIKPDAVVADRAAQMEVGVRQGEDMALVIVVNHDMKDNEGTVTVRGLRFEPRWARRLFVGEDNLAPVRLTSGAGEAVSFNVKLPPRQAAMILLAPRQPARLPESLVP